MAQDILRGNFDFNVDLFIFVLFVIVVFFLMFKVVPSLIIKILHKSNPKEHNSSCSSCLLTIVSIVSIFGVFTASAYLYVEYKDSVKSKFYYHVSSNGIHYDIPKVGKKKAIVTSVKEGIYAIDIPEFVTYKNVKCPVIKIGEKAFKECYNLNSVVIGDSVRYICDNAFCYCSNLEYLKVKSGNPVYYSTDRCDAIILREYYGGKNYKKLTVGCANTIIPEDVTSIGDYAFSGRVNMTSITIPSSVKDIGESAFNSCYGLTSVTIPDSVINIDSYAFYRCKNLTSVVISESVKGIYHMAFYGCNSLTDVYCYAKEPPSSWIPRSFDHQSPFDETFIKGHTTLHVPASSIERYRREAPWSQFKSIVAIE